MITAIAIASLLSSASAFPFVAKMDGVDTRLLRKRQQPSPSAADCPFNADHVPAAAWNSDYPYNYAYNGSEGKGVGGYLVPADGDTDHVFMSPTSVDIRGPCPGLNAAANHNFLARDGITTFDELVDAQQNVYNVGYDLAMLLALLGLTLTDGDVVTQKLSIGCDATSRTSYDPTLTGSEPGLDGHNHFEADTSLTRDDYFLGDGNDSRFNGTLFGMMYETTGGTFDRDGLALYRKQRYDQSLAENPNFYFGPLSLLLFGAASFLYELMPSGPDYTPDIATISSFFGTSQDENGTWVYNGGEKIPDDWTNRVAPYTNEDVTDEIVAMYLEYPVLFGGATGTGSFDLLPTFDGVTNSSGYIDLSDTTCLLYQLATQSIPDELDSVLTPTVTALDLVLTKLSPTLDNLGCPIPLTKRAQKAKAKVMASKREVSFSA